MQEAYYLYLPNKSKFDVEHLAEQISRHPEVVRDFGKTPTFIVCIDAKDVDHVQSRLADPSTMLTGYGCIILRPEYIVIRPGFAIENLTKIVAPIITELRCVIANEYGVDFTSYYEGQIGRMFDDNVGEDRPIKQRVIPEPICVDGNGIEWTDNIVKVHLKAVANTDAAARLIEVFAPKLGTSDLVSFAIDQPSDPKHWQGMEETRKAFGVVEACNVDLEFVTVTVATRGALEISPPRPVASKPN